MRQLDDNAVTMTRQCGNMHGDLQCDIQGTTATIDYTLTQQEHAATTLQASVHVAPSQVTGFLQDPLPRSRVRGDGN